MNRITKIALEIGAAIVAVGSGFRWIVGLMGDADFLITRVQDPAWIGASLQWLLSTFPLWSAPITLILALVLIVLLVWRTNGVPRTPKPSREFEKRPTKAAAKAAMSDKPPIEVEAFQSLPPVGESDPGGMVHLHNRSDEHFEKRCLVKVEYVTRFVRADRSSMVSHKLDEIPQLVLKTEN